MNKPRKIILTSFAVILCIALMLVARVRFLPKPFPSAIVVHESASTWGDVQSIRSWHKSRGWSDIGYHAVILNGHRSSSSAYNPKLDGKIEPGRPENERGSHCEAENMNAVALGVCLVGLPGRGGYPTKQQLNSLVHYCAIKCVQYDIPIAHITQHSDHEPRKPLCASLDMNYIRSRVRAELDKRSRH
jgi:hypothetical protein